MSKYGQYCPVAQALEIIGDKWTLLIIRDMLTGTRHFNDMLRGLPRLSRSLLTKRLRQLQASGIIEKLESQSSGYSTEYVLTQSGIELQNVINSLLVWGTAWSFNEPRAEDLDPLLLMWWMRRRINIDKLPDARITIEFDFYDPKCDPYWLVLNQEDIAVCVTEPGFEICLIVRANLKSFFKVWLGVHSYKDAKQKNEIILQGLPRFQRAFPDWFAWSPAASYIHNHRR